MWKIYTNVAVFVNMNPENPNGNFKIVMQHSLVKPKQKTIDKIKMFQTSCNKKNSIYCLFYSLYFYFHALLF